MEEMFEKRAGKLKQEEFWVATTELPRATPEKFYRRVNATLAEMGFAEAVWAICKSAYADVSKGGRPGIDPVVYLKMIMVGFFENLPSERAIASRCEDSLSIRAFLGYGVTEATPDHSSLSVIRDRLSVEQMELIHGELLKALRAHGLLKGRQLGIDASVIEANASLRALESRNTEENYWDYVKRLAAEAGVDPNDVKAVRRFDKKRKGRKTSNDDWKNPHDPEAKVGRTKDGATDMTYKPEHVSDLETGAIIHAEVRLGDEADNDESLCERVMTAVDVLEGVMPDVSPEKLARELAADEGYFAIGPISELQACGVRTIIGDPQAERRRLDKMTEEERRAWQRARRAVRSQSGKAALRRRGEHLERAFCHVLDHGKLRRATLRGQENLTKRFKLGALSYNLSLLMRHLIGVGTPKQAQAGVGAAFGALLYRLLRFTCSFLVNLLAVERRSPRFPSQPFPAPAGRGFSTGC
jgi:transposase